MCPETQSLVPKHRQGAPLCLQGRHTPGAYEDLSESPLLPQLACCKLSLVPLRKGML